MGKQSMDDRISGMIQRHYMTGAGEAGTAGADPLTASALAGLAELGVVRCGIHGDVIVERRCGACDAGRCLDCGDALEPGDRWADADSGRYRCGSCHHADEILSCGMPGCEVCS